MTYRERLEQLSADSIHTLDVYTHAVISGNTDIDTLTQLKAEWELAEDAHASSLDLIKTNLAKLDEPI